MDDPDPVLGGNINHFLEKIQLNALRSRIAGEIEHQHFWLRPGFLNRFLQFFKEIHIRRQTHMAHISTSDNETIGMNRIGRIRH